MASSINKRKRENRYKNMTMKKKTAKKNWKKCLGQELNHEPPASLIISYSTTPRR